MPVDIVFRDGDQLLPLVIDATVEEGHRASSMVTEHEVEEGVNRSDHIRPERRLLTLDVRISDTPVFSTSALNVAQENAELSLPGRATVEGEPTWDGQAWSVPEVREGGAQPTFLSVFAPDTLPGSLPGRVAESWALIMEARARSLLADITTKYETYESMALTEIVAPRVAADASWLRASLSFVEFRSVSTELVDDPVPARLRDQKQKDRGSQEARRDPPEGLRSIANQISSLFGGS